MENPLEEQETSFVFLLPKTITVLQQVEDCIIINYYCYYYYLKSRYLPPKYKQVVVSQGTRKQDSSEFPPTKM